MELPEELQNAIEALVEAIPPSALKKAREALSKTYSISGSSTLTFRDGDMRLAYLASRMPATYAAVASVLKYLPISPKQWLDLGAGPGTASWAIATLFPSALQGVLIEQNQETIVLGKQLASVHPVLSSAQWRSESLPVPISNADVAIFSYSLGELASPLAMIDAWEKSDIPFLVIVEPGTPRGFSLIRKARDRVLEFGAKLIAPCPHAFACPLKGDDWCHFSVRLPRSRLHRYLKGGDLGYEDEKYSYLIASRSAFETPSARILRHPQKNSGHVRLVLCTEKGAVEEITVTKSNKQAYRAARDASWGDPWGAKE